MMLPGKILAGFSGVLINVLGGIYGEGYGWMSFFIFTSTLTIPSILLIWFYKNKYANDLSLIHISEPKRPERIG